MTPPSGESTRALVAAVLADPPRPAPWLRAVEGPRAGDELALRDGAVLGRGRGADLRLADGLASRRHARFTRAGARWRVHDLGSKNGLRVNGRAAAPEGSPLEPGDRLAVGRPSLIAAALVAAAAALALAAG